jgi:hypothetical protein
MVETSQRENDGGSKPGPGEKFKERMVVINS